MTTKIGLTEFCPDYCVFNPAVEKELAHACLECFRQFDEVVDPYPAMLEYRDPKHNVAVEVVGRNTKNGNIYVRGAGGQVSSVHTSLVKPI